MRNKRNNIFHKSFEVGVIIKGFDGLLEVIGGVLIFFIKPSTIYNLFNFVFYHELVEDPNDLIVNHILKAVSHFTHGTVLFSSIYLLSHGLIKIVLAWALLKQKLWSYPVSIVFLLIFIIYQIYRYTYTHSIMLILLTIFDIVIIWLTVKEYSNIKNAVKETT